MRTGTAISILLLLMAGSPVEARAQTSLSDEQAVRLLDDQARIAALKRDRSTLERLWADEFVVNAPSNEVVVGKAAVLDWVERGIINFSSFERQVEFVRVDGDFAILMGSESVTPIGDAPKAGLRAGQTIHRRFTNIWKRNAGTWRLYARHANVVPAR